MVSFHHHPDGLVYLRGETGIYQASLVMFEAHCQALNLPTYSGIEPPFLERRYDGQSHNLCSPQTQEKAVFPWQEGDAYLAAYARFLEVQEQDSRPIPLTREQIIQKKTADIMERRLACETGGVLLDGKWFFTGDSHLKQYDIAWKLGASFTPVPWMTMDGSFVTMTKELLDQINAAIFAKGLQIVQNAQSHIAAVKASSDPENYDFSSGWPQSYGE